MTKENTSLKTGKIFGKINIVDIVVLLALIICVVGVYYRFYGRAGKTVVEGTEFTYQIKVTGIRQGTINALQKAVGTRFSSSEKGRTDDLGILENFEYSQAVENIEKTDGTIVSATMPERYDVVLTLRLNGKVNDRGYFTPQLRDLGVGSEIKFKSKWVTAEGVIKSIQPPQ